MMLSTQVTKGYMLPRTKSVEDLFTLCIKRVLYHKAKPCHVVKQSLSSIIALFHLFNLACLWVSVCDDEPSVVAPATEWFSKEMLTVQTPRRFQQSNLYDAEEQLRGKFQSPLSVLYSQQVNSSLPCLLFSILNR